LKGCVKAVTSEGNICEFLRRADEEVIPAGRGWGDCHRAMAILELLMDAGVRHGEECGCGRSGRARGHHVLGWSLCRERAERENQGLYTMAAELFLKTKGTRSAIAGDGRREKDQDEYSLWRTKDGLYQNPRGWYWESPEAYLQSEPWHPTWRTVRLLGSQYRFR